MTCKSSVFLSALAIYLVIYFQFLNTKHGHIFVYKIYGDEEAINSIKIEENDTELAFVIGIGLVFVGIIMITYMSRAICTRPILPDS